MAQSNENTPEPTVAQILDLVHQLSFEEQTHVVEPVALELLERDVQIGIDELDRGEFVDGDELLEELIVSAEAKV